MTKHALEQQFDLGVVAVRECARLLGDSPDNAPLFSCSPNLVGAAKARAFAGLLLSYSLSQLRQGNEPRAWAVAIETPIGTQYHKVANKKRM